MKLSCKVYKLTPFMFSFMNKYHSYVISIKHILSFCVSKLLSLSYTQPSKTILMTPPKSVDWNVLKGIVNRRFFWIIVTIHYLLVHCCVSKHRYPWHHCKRESLNIRALVNEGLVYSTLCIHFSIPFKNDILTKVNLPPMKTFFLQNISFH